MTLFASSAFNRVYAHGALQAFAEAGGGVFFAVFLLKAGLGAPLVLVTLAVIFLGRLVLRQGVLPLARRIGLRNTLIIGTLLDSSTYWLVPYVDGPGLLLLLLIGIGSLGSVCYWTSYHAYVASAGDNTTRGTQVGAIEALNALVGVVAPAVVSVLILSSGPKIAFAAVALVQMTAALPLIGAPAMPVPAQVADDAPGRRFGFRLYFADGWTVAATHFVWQIALFVTLGEAVGAYGGAIVLAGLFGAVASFTIGRSIDRGYGTTSVAIAYTAAALATLAKFLAVDSPWAAVAAAAGAMAGAIQIPAMMARLYTLAKSSPCPLRFHMATEAGFDLGAASCCLAAAALIASGANLGTPIALAFAGIATVYVMLRGSYRADASQRHVVER